MCILCVIQKWSRRIATMLPWLVIPLIGLWALSQLLPPAFRFEITSSRLACVLVLLVTLFWYEVLMPQLSAWQIRRDARLRERKRSEAIELEKLRKTATRRCRNCFTAYRDQNPGGGKFMCSYCGHISKRPVLDFPVLPGMNNSGILKNLVSKGGKILNGKAWSENGWMCGQELLDIGNWGSGSLAGKSNYWQNNGSDLFGGDHDRCLTERSYSHILIFACKVLTRFFSHVTWLWRKLFRVSSSRDDASADAEHREMLDNCSENGVNGQESRVEKARRKAEEKRLARLEKELLEEEERKQREEVAKLVEERRRLRDEKMEAEKEHGKGSSRVKESGDKKESERKRQEKKKEKDRGSSKSSSDAEEFDKRATKESERNKSENDRKEQHRTTPGSMKAHGAEAGPGFKGNAASNHDLGNAGTRYLDRMRGTFLSSSRAFTGGSFFGKNISTSTVSREYKPGTMIENSQTSTYGKDSGRSTTNGGNKTNHPVLVEAQPSAAPRKSWQQLFTRSSAVFPSSSLNAISRPAGNCETVQNPLFSGHPTSTQSFDNPMNVGLSSPFSLPSFSLGSSGSNTVLSLSSEPMVSGMKDLSHQFLPEESEIFEDPCYDPDPISLLGPVSESLDEFHQDLGFVTDTELEEPFSVNTDAKPSEITKPLPIVPPLLRSHVSEEAHPNSFHFPSTTRAHNINHINCSGAWQMWNTTPLGQDGLGLVSGPISWPLHPENFPSKEDKINPVPQRTMASLFKKDEQARTGTHSSQKVSFGNCQKGGTFNAPVPSILGDPWLPETLFGPTSRTENQIPSKPKKEKPSGSAATSWDKDDRAVQGSGNGIGNSATSSSQLEACTQPRIYSLFGHMIR